MRPRATPFALCLFARRVGRPPGCLRPGRAARRGADDDDARAAEAEAAEHELTITCQRLRANIEVFRHVFVSFSGMRSYVAVLGAMRHIATQSRLMSDINKSVLWSFGNIFLVSAPLKYAEIKQAYFVNA